MVAGDAPDEGLFYFVEAPLVAPARAVLGESGTRGTVRPLRGGTRVKSSVTRTDCPLVLQINKKGIEIEILIVDFFISFSWMVLCHVYSGAVRSVCTRDR